MIHITYITNTLKTIFEAYKKYFLYSFLYAYIKKVNKLYQKNKERFRKEAREAYQNLSQDKKEKRQKRDQGRYKTIYEEEKEETRQYHHDRNSEIVFFLKEKGKRNIYIYMVI